MMRTVRMQNRDCRPVIFLTLVVCFVLVVGSVHTSFGAQGGFAPRGPGGAGGIYVPCFSDVTKGLVFLGTDMGAAFRSTTGGRSWELLHWNNALRFMQESPKAVFFDDVAIWSARFRRIKRSTDLGVTWESLESRPWEKEKVNQLLALRGTPDVLLVGAERSVWRSEDKGESYKKVWAQGTSEFVELDGVVYTMAYPNTLLVSSDRGMTWKPKPVSLEGISPKDVVLSLAGGKGSAGHTLFASLKGVGIMKTENGGDSWKLVHSPYSGEKLLLMAPGQDRVVYAAQIGSQRNSALLRSKDGGMTWENSFRINVKWSQRLFAKPNVTPSWAQTELFWGYYITNRGVALDPFDPNHLILTTQGDAYETRDGGDSWEPIINNVLPPSPGDKAPRYESIGLEITSCWGYYFDPFDSMKHYATYSDIGFVRSVDGGKTWSWAANGSPWLNTFYELAMDPKVSGLLFAAASNRHDIPHDMALAGTNPNIARNRGGVVVSRDNGKSWQVLYDGKSPGSLPKLVCTTVALDEQSPVGSRTLYAGLFGEGSDAGVYRSDDGGKNWVKKSKGLGVAPNLHVLHVSVHPVSGNLYCLITGLRMGKDAYRVPGGVWKSTDKGESWTHISAGSNLNWHATSLWVNPDDEAELYVTATTPAGHWLTGGLYRTEDGGKSWDHILTDKQIAKAAGASYTWDHTMSFLAHPDDPNLLYVGTTHHGLMYSLDKGKTWKNYMEFPYNTIQSIQVVPGNNDRIVVTTFGGGMWEGPKLP